MKYVPSPRSLVKNLACLGGLSLLLSLCVRAFFFLDSPSRSGSFAQWIFTFLLGTLSDLSVLFFFLGPIALCAVLFPGFRKQERGQRFYKWSFSLFFLAATFFLFLSSAMELVFWNEFHVRANFIAVDYLVYTHEVLGNIWESYPIGQWLGGLLAVALILTLFFAQKILSFDVVPRPSMKARSGAVLALVALFLVNFQWSSVEAASRLHNHPREEVAKNGTAALLYAYVHNQLDYEKFYARMDLKDSFREVRKIFAKESSSLNLSPYDIGRWIKNPGPHQTLNVIVVSMESMSAQYLGVFGNKKGLTPYLDRFAREGLFFSNVLATGTRTVRGLEAMSLSIPPTPGQSIIRRPKNKDFYNVGDTFLHAGYDSEFLYGGYSYFDNMEEFFTANEFRVWDRTDLRPSEFTFGNIWGACDEDLFKLSLRRADDAYSRQKPFFQLVMTTSNHRPYTYPQKIDIPSGTGREGAIKYSDYAIGQFIEQARSKPWFKDTLFVFIADHDGSVSGQIETPVKDYRIPLIVYSPAHLQPQTVRRLGSQIDLGPTLFGLLRFSYKSHFFGHDLMKENEDRAFISTYQTVGYLKNHVLTLLSPNRVIKQFTVDQKDQTTPLEKPDQNLIREAIAYYQTANFLFSQGEMKDVGDDMVLGFDPNLHK